jgi:hypothetical protein
VAHVSLFCVSVLCDYLLTSKCPGLSPESKHNVENLVVPKKVASMLGSSPADLGYVQLESQLGVGTFGKVGQDSTCV